MNHTQKHILIIIGSIRPQNYTSKAVAIVEDELKKNHSITYEILDAAKLKLPLPGSSYEESSHDMMQEAVKKATGVILAAPEYHGGISSVMKLIIDNLGFPSTLAGKPISLLGVAAGSIGAIKSLEQTRSICSHVGAMVIPSSISVPNIRDVFDDQGHCKDPALDKRIRSVATNLVDYIDRHICPSIALESMIRKEKEDL